MQSRWQQDDNRKAEGNQGQVNGSMRPRQHFVTVVLQPPGWGWVVGSLVYLENYFLRMDALSARVSVHHMCA